MNKIPYHENYYLQYHGGKRCAKQDIVGTKGFLGELGFDGGELRQARQKKDYAESYKNVSNKCNQMYCSYCGREISGVEFYRLPDGRMRCTTCSNSIVKTKAEVEELCQRVLTSMDNFFGANIDVAVNIEVVDERKLKRKIGIPLGTTDEQSILILGVAINKRGKYSIILENGAPRISLIATFAHELTHIWQYIHPLQVLEMLHSLEFLLQDDSMLHPLLLCIHLVLGAGILHDVRQLPIVHGSGGHRI